MNALYQASVPTVLRAIERAQHLLSLAPEGLAHARLQEDMFDLLGQVRTLGFLALRATFPLAAREVPQLGALNEREAGTWLEQIAQTINQIPANEFDESLLISHRAGFADLEQPAWDYLNEFALPNLWFHLTMIYAILRLKGVPLSKGDFDGLHEYPEGFSL